MLRQQKEQLKRKRQVIDMILSFPLQTHISVFKRTGDIMIYPKGYTFSMEDFFVLAIPDMILVVNENEG